MHANSETSYPMEKPRLLAPRSRCMHLPHHKRWRPVLSTQARTPALVMAGQHAMMKTWGLQTGA